MRAAPAADRAIHVVKSDTRFVPSGSITPSGRTVSIQRTKVRVGPDDLGPGDRQYDRRKRVSRRPFRAETEGFEGGLDGGHYRRATGGTPAPALDLTDW